MESENMTKIQIAVICGLILNFGFAISGLVLVLKEEARNVERAATTSIQISELVATDGEISKSLSDTNLTVQNNQLKLGNHEGRFTELVETDGTIKESLSDTSLEVQDNKLKLVNHEDRFTELVEADGAIKNSLSDTSRSFVNIQLKLNNHEEIYDQAVANISQELDNHEDLLTVILRSSVRLAGSSSTRGRVEVFYKGEWGTVCNDGWGITDANVVCRMLGFQRATAAFTFGGGTGKIWFDEVQCNGNEASIWQCTWTTTHDCNHSEDAGVNCA